MQGPNPLREFGSVLQLIIDMVRPWRLFSPTIIWKLEAGQQLKFLGKVTAVRMFIESEAAKMSAERASEEEIVEIQKLCNQLGNVLNDESKFNYDVFQSLLTR